MKWFDKALYFMSGAAFVISSASLVTHDIDKAMLNAFLSVTSWLLANWQPRGWGENKHGNK